MNLEDSKMMRAKMKVSAVTRHSELVEELVFSAVSKSDGYPPDGTDENNSYAMWTPSAELNMSITNPVLIGKFQIGQEFYVDFTLAEKRRLSTAQGRLKEASTEVGAT